MVAKNNKIHILLTVFNMSFVILVAMVTILAGKYGLPVHVHIPTAAALKGP